jgi:hypothetical protein
LIIYAEAGPILLQDLTYWKENSVAEQSGNDDIQRALDEAKKEDPRSRYGANFAAVDEPIPVQVEHEWLNQVEEFEHQFAERGMTTVRNFIGNPCITPLLEVPPHLLRAELDRLLRLLAEHQIGIEYDGLVGTAATYDFITTELLDQEIEDVHIPGMVTVFVYGRYYGTDSLDRAIPS